MRILIPQYMARKLDSRDLHAQTDAKVRNAVLPRISRSRDHAFDSPNPKAAGHNDAIRLLEAFGCVFFCQLLAVHPVNLNLSSVLPSAVGQRLCHGQIGIVQPHILTYQRDVYDPFAAVNAVQHRFPFCKITGPLIQA